MHPSPDLLALLALGEDDPDARAHLAGCPPCQHELAGLRRVVSIGRSVTADDVLLDPPPSVWQAVRAGLDAQSATRVVRLPGVPDPARGPAVDDDEPSTRPPGRSDARGRVRPRRLSRPRAAIALAAAAALVVGLGAGWGISRALAPDTDVVGVTTLNALPRWPGANGTATVEKDPQGNRVLVIGMALPPTVSVDGTLQVWMSDSRATDMVSMGVMTASTGRFPIPASVDLNSHPIVDVSLEPKDDKDPRHSEISVLRGRLAL